MSDLVREAIDDYLDRQTGRIDRTDSTILRPCVRTGVRMYVHLLPMNDEQQTNTEFAGFDVPQQNWFKLPHDWTDLTAQMRSWAEQKVVEYVLRHTWGYQEYGKLKRITLDEFENGRKRTDGTRMDRGIGMRRQAIIRGIRQAVEDGFLVEQVDATR